MGARHIESLGTKVKKNIDADEQIYRELTKVQSTQLPVPPVIFAVSGKGRGGLGTTFPILYPNEDLGVITTSPLNLNLGEPRIHYKKFAMDVNDLVVNFKELIEGRSVFLILDVTIQTTTFNSLTFSPALNNAPTIPSAAGSRFLLYIIGYKTASEERFEVLNSGGSATIGGVIITPVQTINNPNAALDIDLSIRQHYVINLDKNIVITFTGLPPLIESSEQMILEFVQDLTGGRTVGYTQTINPSIPAISTVPSAREVVTGFVRRDLAGVHLFNLYLVGN